MKIRSEQLDYLLRQEQLGKTAPTAAPKESFGSLFDQEIGQTTSEGMEALPPPGAHGIDPMLLASLEDTAGTAENDLSEDVNQLMSQADGMIDTLDSYAQTLGNGAAPARNAWELLGNLDSQVASLKGNLSRLPANTARELESVVNELEVLSATEKFKFNRGDYL